MNHFIKGDMLTIFSFYLRHKNIFEKSLITFVFVIVITYFSYKKESNKKIFMPYIEMTRENGQLLTSVYCRLF